MAGDATALANPDLKADAGRHCCQCYPLSGDIGDSQEFATFPPATAEAIANSLQFHNTGPEPNTRFDRDEYQRPGRS